MKWLAGFLLLLNAGLFLWATGHDPGRSAPASAHPVVSAESMRLLSEVRSDRAAAADNGPRCARIGPFVSSAVAALAAQQLDAMSLSYHRRTVRSREIRVFRLFLGPFHSQSAIEAQRRLLESGGIDNYYVKRGEDGGAIISLGLFSRQEGAEVLRNRLAENGVDARLRTEDRALEPNFWFEIRDPGVAAAIPRELVDSNWGESEARVRYYQCP
jgi:hypothetical protein